MVEYIVIEDNPNDLKSLRSLLKLDKRFYELMSFDNLEDFSAYIKHHTVQLVFADIKIGKLNLLDYWNKLPYAPELILVSAYPEFALNAFEHDALHYLTKPIQADQLHTALERAFRKIKLNNQDSELNFFFLQSGKNKYHRVEFDELLYVEANGEYLNLHLSNQRHISVFKRLKSLIQELPAAQFKQLHRSYIVNVNCIESIESNDLLIKDGARIPIGKMYKSIINDLIYKNTTTVQNTNL